MIKGTVGGHVSSLRDVNRPSRKRRRRYPSTSNRGPNLETSGVQSYDKESGTVYYETEILAPTTMNGMESWIDESWGSRYGSLYAKPAHKTGVNTLSALAANCLAANLRYLDLEVLQAMPEHLVRTVWECATKSDSDSLRTWALFISAYGSFDGISRTRAEKLDRSIDLRLVLSGICRILTDVSTAPEATIFKAASRPSCQSPMVLASLAPITGFPFMTFLDLKLRSTLPHGTSETIQALAKLPNLLVLRIRSGHRLIDDRVLTGWARSSQESRGFPSLRVFLLQSPYSVTSLGLTNLQLLPKLIGLYLYYQTWDEPPVSAAATKNIWVPVHKEDYSQFLPPHSSQRNRDLRWREDTLSEELVAFARCAMDMNRDVLQAEEDWARDFDKAMAVVKWNDKSLEGFRSELGYRGGERYLSLTLGDWYVRKFDARRNEGSVIHGIVPERNPHGDSLRKRPKLRQGKQPMDVEEFLGA